jgi:hypothetical protein
MKLLKKILMSTPVLLVIFLVLVILGFILLGTGIFALSYYSDISISVIFVATIFFVLRKHRKVRRPLFTEHFYSDESSKKNVQRHWNLWREESRFVLASGLLVSTLTVTNYWYGFTTAPVVFLVYGAFFIIIFYLINNGPFEVSDLKLSVSKLDGNKAVPTFFQVTMNYFIILILISGFWFYQINKNLATQREAGYEAALDLIDFSYCNYNLNVCGAVDLISNVNFAMERVEDGPGKSLKMCVRLNFKYSLQDGEYDSDYRDEEICFSPSRYGGYWSDYELEGNVRDVLKQKIG